MLPLYCHHDATRAGSTVDARLQHGIQPLSDRYALVKHGTYTSHTHRAHVECSFGTPVHVHTWYEIVWGTLPIRYQHEQSVSRCYKYIWNTLVDDWQLHTFNFGHVDDFLTWYSLVRATCLGVTAPLAMELSLSSTNPWTCQVTSIQCFKRLPSWGRTCSPSRLRSNPGTRRGWWYPPSPAVDTLWLRMCWSLTGPRNNASPIMSRYRWRWYPAQITERKKKISLLNLKNLTDTIFNSLLPGDAIQHCQTRSIPCRVYHPGYSVDLGQHWITQLHVVCSASSHHLNHYWFPIN